MGQIEKHTSRFNTLVETITNFFVVGGLFGITPASAVAALGYVGFLVWQLISQSVPGYAIAIAILFAAGGVLHLYAGVVKARSVIGLKKISLSAVAEACERLEERYWNFREANEATIRAINETNYIRSEDSESWDRGNLKRANLEAELMRDLSARLGADIGSVVAMLQSLNIQARADFRSIYWNDSNVRYYATVGRLLRGGHLEEAQKLDHWFF